MTAFWYRPYKTYDPHPKLMKILVSNISSLEINSNNTKKIFFMSDLKMALLIRKNSKKDY